MYQGFVVKTEQQVQAIAELKHAGFRDYMAVTTPMPRHEVEDLMYEGVPSPVRWFTMFGGMFGATSLRGMP